MNIFKTITLKWWQAGFFKWGLLVLGIVIGSHWHDFFSDYLPVLILIALASLGYITWVWWKQ